MNSPQVIPKIIHRVWFGTKPFPDKFLGFVYGQTHICKEYSSMFWEEENTRAHFPYMLPSSAEMLSDTRLNPVIKSDILRYEALRLFGGIYLDTDIEVLRNFDELLSETFFCADEGMDNIGTAVLGCVPYHPLTHAMLLAIYANYLDKGIPKSPNDQMAFGGPWLFTQTAKRFNVTVLNRQLLYPFHNPRLPAAIHYFNGGESTTGWTKKLSKEKNDTQNHPSDLARQRSDSGASRVFLGRNNQVLQRS